MTSKEKFNIPVEVLSVLSTLQGVKHDAYIVGGCVRDLLRETAPKDWDVTTSAKPEEIMSLFHDSFYENKFLTVTVKTESEDPTLKEIEVTTYRAEGKYTDKRHPDEVRFAEKLEDDLSRRDFTVNAMALDADGVIIDLYGGKQDVEQKIIRAVGDAEKRFEEDALRMLRAARLATELEFEIEPATHVAIKKHAGLLSFIADERIRDELFKILMTPRAKDGIELLHELGLLQHIVPELEEGIDVENRPRIFTIWEHNLKALEYGARQNFPLDVRIAAMLHDVGKPRTKGPMKNGEWTYYGHDVVGGKMAAEILERLHCSHAITEKIAILIRWHLFKYELDQDDEQTTDSSIRRLIRHVGPDRMDDLVKLRICDRMGMGVPKAVPYRLRHFQYRVEKILREEEAPTPKMLKIGGAEIMKLLRMDPGPKIGRIIEVLLQEVIDDPAKNTTDELTKRVEEIGSLADNELEEMARAAESKVEMVEDERIAKLKAKYYVK